MSKPTNLAEWATAAAAIDEPSTPEKQAGWGVDTKPPAQWFNWWQNLVHLWIVWLDAFESTAHTWSATQTFATIAVTTINSVSLALSGTLAVTGMATLSGGLTLSRSGATDPQIEASAVATSRRLLFRQKVATGPDNFVRVYVSALGGLEVTFNAVWDGSQWDREDTFYAAYRARLNFNQGFRFETKTSSPWADNAWDSAFKLYTTGVVGDVLTVTSGQEFSKSSRITQQAWTAAGVTINAGVVTSLTTSEAYVDTLGRCHVRGTVQSSGSVTTGTVIATLAVGYRPDRDLWWWPGSFYDAASGAWDRTDFRLRIKTNGDIVVELQSGAPNFNTASNWSFDGMSFRIA